VAIWWILWLFGIHFLLYLEKIWQPCTDLFSRLESKPIGTHALFGKAHSLWARVTRLANWSVVYFEEFFCKLHKWRKCMDYFSPVYQLCIYIDRKWLGYTLGDFFYKLMWSHWLRPRRKEWSWSCQCTRLTHIHTHKKTRWCMAKIDRLNQGCQENIPNNQKITQCPLQMQNSLKIPTGHT
jgi:hypothetical protein